MPESLTSESVSNPANHGDQKVKTPLYRHIVDILRMRITQNIYPVGSVIPAEDILAIELQVSRHTVREALRRLREEGLVVSRQGAGTTVAFASRRTSYVQEVDSIQHLIQYAKTTRYQVNSTEIVTCNKQLATVIGCELNSRWLRFEGLRYPEKSDTPVCRNDVYVREEYSGVSRLVARGHTAIYEMIEDLYGEKISEVRQDFRGVDATRTVAKQLGIEVGDALIEVKRSYCTSNGKLAEVAVNLFPYRRFSFAMTLKSIASHRP